MAAVRVKKSFVHFMKGRPVHVHSGDLFDDSDPCVKKFPQAFEPVDHAVARRAGVEAATSEPGVLRSLTSPRRAPRKAADSASSQDD